MLEPGDQGDFLEQLLHPDAPHRLCRHDLEGDLATAGNVHREVDSPHSALRQLPDE
jgi:hypothetical protein